MKKFFVSFNGFCFELDVGYLFKFSDLECCVILLCCLNSYDSLRVLLIMVLFVSVFFNLCGGMSIVWLLIDGVEMGVNIFLFLKVLIILSWWIRVLGFKMFWDELRL